jgi:hypothetical protein
MPPKMQIAESAVNLTLVLCAALGLGACSFTPAPVIRYRAAEAAGIWTHGLHLSAARTPLLEIQSGFLEFSPDPVLGLSGPRPLFFALSVTNASDAAKSQVLLDPGDFRMTMPGKDTVIAALDPEAVILEARKDLASEDARYGGTLGTEAGLATAAFALDIASLFARQTEKEKEDWEESRERDRQRRKDEKSEHEERVRDINRRIDEWSGQSVRKTTMPPGMKVAGRIGFGLPARSDAPDSLVLQYKYGGAYHDLARYGLVRDSVSAPAAKPPVRKAYGDSATEVKIRNPWERAAWGDRAR